jgi:hypothetical protein
VKEVENLKKIITKSMAIVMGLLLVFSFMPVLSNAGTVESINVDNNPVLINETGSYIITGNGTKNSNIVIGADSTVTLKDITINDLDDNLPAVKIENGVTATILIHGAVSLTGGKNAAGIEVTEDAKLNLTGSGDLTTIGNNGKDDSKSGGAGIGGSNGSTVGTINIDGLGGLTALAYGVHVAGIGGGNSDITINNTHILKVAGGYAGAKLTSKYGKSDPEAGAAIGSAGGKDAGNITITNSTLDSVAGGSKSAGIGAGYWGGTGTILIENTTIGKCVGGSSSAAIGLARVNKNYASKTSEIIIKNSTIEAIGGDYGSAIGTGYNDGSVGSIGSDGQPNGTLGSTSITIIGSNVNAIGGEGGAAIGGGYKGWNCVINIETSHVYAQGGVLSDKTKYIENGAAAIGTGANGSACFGGGTISIDRASEIVAISNGGKWAIDLSCDVDGVNDVYQNMFLTDTAIETCEGTIVKNEGDNCELLTDAIDSTSSYYTVKMAANSKGQNGVEVKIPVGMYCAAVSTDKDGHYNTAAQDSTKVYSYYPNMDSSEYADATEFDSAYVDMDTEVSELEKHSYKFVAIRDNAVSLAPETPDETDDTVVAPTEPTDPADPSDTDTDKDTSLIAGTTGSNGTSGTHGTTATNGNATTTTVTRVVRIASINFIGSNNIMVINDADKTPAESALAETVTLEDDEVPLAGKSSSHWALINLILTLITIAISIVLLVMYFRHDDEEYEDEGFLVHVTYKKKGLARILSIIPGIIAIIAFILTEDITLPIGLIDRWTPIMLLIALIEVGFVIVAQKEKEEDASYIME